VNEKKLNAQTARAALTQRSATATVKAGCILMVWFSLELKGEKYAARD